MRTMLIVGCGYVGSYVGRLWLKKGHRVWAVTTSTARVPSLESEGFEAIVADVRDPASLKKLPRTEVVLYSVGPRGHHDSSRWELYKDGLAHVLAAIDATTLQVALVSSTGVYGDYSRDWIDEHAPRNPQRGAARALAAAEDLLLDPSWRDRAYIFRLGGLYGPRRVPLISKLVQGQLLPKSPDSLLNLIHVEDAAIAIDRVLSRGSPPCVVNVVDGHPVMRRDFYGELARLLGAPSPQFTQVTAASGKREPLPAPSRKSGIKRVSNKLLVEAFGMSFRYPDYRRGLAQIVQHESYQGESDV